MAAAEHQRPGAVEAVDERERVAGACGPRDRQSEQQHEEQDQRRCCPTGPGPGGRHVGRGRRLRLGQKSPAEEAAGDDRADLPERGRQAQRQDRRRRRERRARTVRTQAARHAPHGLGDDGDGDRLQPVEPGRARRSAQPDHAIAEGDERQRRWQGEADPRGGGARQSAAPIADGQADLAARRARQELAERDDVGELALVEPAAAGDELAVRK